MSNTFPQTIIDALTLGQEQTITPTVHRHVVTVIEGGINEKSLSLESSNVMKGNTTVLFGCSNLHSVQLCTNRTEDSVYL